MLTKQKRAKSLLRQVGQNKSLLMMLSPTVLYTILFSYIPMVGVILAFKSYNYAKGVFGSPWNGVGNFRFLFLSNKLWALTRNTLLYNFAFIVVGIILEVGFAILLNEIRCKWFKKIFQSFMFLPHFLSWVIAVALVQAIFHYEYGFINRIIAMFGGNPIDIYTTKSVWPILLVCFTAWKRTGYGSVVYLAAVTGIDPGLYEAASIDGANNWQRIFHITLPPLLPTILIMFLMAVGQIFRGDFGMFFQLVGNNGVILEVADILDLYVYRALASNSNIGMGAAAGLYQSVLCFITVVCVNALVKKIDPDYSLF